MKRHSGHLVSAVESRSGQSWRNASRLFALVSMASCEEYRHRAERARREAKMCRDEWERQILLAIADQLERIVAYKELTSVRPDHPAGQSNILVR
jgi:hypothetical protein